MFVCFYIQANRESQLDRGMVMKKSTKIIIITVSVLIIAAGLVLLNGLYGNPVSKKRAEHTAEKYIQEMYPQTNYQITEVFYNFKDGYYHAQIESETSIDTHFTVAIQTNKVVYDSYEDDVTSGWNTYQRIDQAYREKVEEVFDEPNFPIRSDIDFGTFELIEADQTYDEMEADYGLMLEELEIDQSYDLHNLAETKGHIIYYGQDEEISYEKAAEHLQIIKEALDQADLPFYAIDYTLEKPRNEDGTGKGDDETIDIVNFPYTNISDSNITEQIEAAHHKLAQYYEEQDKDMQE